MLASEFVTSARELIGVPWRHMGRTPHGLDCIGLVILAGKRRGVDFTKWAPDRKYGKEAAPDLMKEVNVICRPLPMTARVPGSLVCFKFPGDRWPRHVAIMSESETIIHAEMRKRGCVIEHGYRAQWACSWADSMWMLPGIDYREFISE